MYKLKENYTVGTKGLCSTDLFNEVFIDFYSYGFYRGNLLQLLQMKDAPILLDGNIFNSKQLGKYIVFTVGP